MKGFVEGFPGMWDLLEPTDTVAVTEVIWDENTGSLIGVVLAEDIGKVVIGRLGGKDSEGAGAGGLDINWNELFLFGQGRLGGGGGGGWVWVILSSILLASILGGRRSMGIVTFVRHSGQSNSFLFLKMSWNYYNVFRMECNHISVLKWLRSVIWSARYDRMHPLF